MLIYPHEVTIDAPRTNAALPIRQGIADFFDKPSRVVPAKAGTQNL